MEQRPKPQFIGLQNFTMLFQDASFYNELLIL